MEYMNFKTESHTLLKPITEMYFNNVQEMSDVL